VTDIGALPDDGGYELAARRRGLHHYFLYPEVAAHVMRVTETAHWLEWQDWADPILQKPYDIKNGLLHIPEVPRVSLEWDEDAMAANQDRL